MFFIDVAPPPDEAIIITASRLDGEDQASSTSEISSETLERLGDPLVVDFLRLTPSASISTSGPTGSLAEVRIRGAEANHTLLFIDGIRANDPAAGNTPRFELLNADIASRIEVVRGPQSALWGSESIGGVIAVSGIAPTRNSAALNLEGGSFGSARGSASGQIRSGDVGISLSAAHQRARGIDSFDGNGDRDGYRNTALRGLVTWDASELVQLNISGFHLSGRSEFDGFDPITFLRGDTSDETENRLTAGRIGVEIGADKDWSGSLSASLLGSRNRNLLAGSELNETRGGRFTIDAQLQHRFETGDIAHAATVAGQYEREHFEAEDVAFGGFTTQDRSRTHWSLTGEWRATWQDRITANVALRHDSFNRFKDATTLRASLAAKLAEPITVAVSYGEGIAQPTFFDLYGFFPGSFVGNPSLKPERSKGWEASIRAERDNWRASLTYYRQTLRDEIVSTFDPMTFLSGTANGAGRSKRQGIELDAAWHWREGHWVGANYAWLDADEPQTLGGDLREVRRPKHSGSFVAHGQFGRFTYGLSIAHVGKRIDTDFDLFPAQRVTLNAYWLVGARIAYSVTDGVELYGRISNAFDETYQDVVGYRTEGRAAFAGLRIAFDR